MKNFFLLFFISVLSFSCSSFKKDWDYKGVYDPGHWHEISKKAKMCKMGHHQSPININTKKALSLNQKLEVYYHRAPLKVVNNGHTIEFDTLDSHYILLDEKKYNLIQFHFHSHSEHSIDGKYYPVEMHLVHKSIEGDVVVLGVYQEVFEFVRGHHVFDKIPQKKRSVMANLDLANLLPKNMSRYVYDGSLTTPPCTENVTWLIFKEPVKISKKEIDKFRMYYTENYRPAQKEYLRSVYMVTQ